MYLAAVHQVEVTGSLATLEGSVVTAATAWYREAEALGRTVQRVPTEPTGNKVVQPIQCAGEVGRCMHQRVGWSRLLLQTTSGHFGSPQFVFVLGEGMGWVSLVAQSAEGIGWVLLLAQTAEGIGRVRLLTQTTSDQVGFPVVVFAEGLTKRRSFGQEHLYD